MRSAWRSPNVCTNARFGDDLVDHWTYVLAGDGCLMEGISHEAIDFAGPSQAWPAGRLLGRQFKITIDGSTDISTSTDQVKPVSPPPAGMCRRWTAMTRDAIAAAIEAAREVTDPRPSMIACRDHHRLSAPPTSRARPQRAWRTARRRGDRGHRAQDARLAATPPFDRSRDDIRAAWHAPSPSPWSRPPALAWESAPARLGHDKPDAFRQSARGRSGCTAPSTSAIDRITRHGLSAEAPKVATRKASTNGAGDRQRDSLPNSVGGSADLTGSNLTTRTKRHAPTVTADGFLRRLHPFRRARTWRWRRS